MSEAAKHLKQQKKKTKATESKTKTKLVLPVAAKTESKSKGKRGDAKISKKNAEEILIREFLKSMRNSDDNRLNKFEDLLKGNDIPYERRILIAELKTLPPLLLNDFIDQYLQQGSNYTQYFKLWNKRTTKQTRAMDAVKQADSKEEKIITSKESEEFRDRVDEIIMYIFNNAKAYCDENGIKINEEARFTDMVNAINEASLRVELQEFAGKYGFKYKDTGIILDDVENLIEDIIDELKRKIRLIVEEENLDPDKKLRGNLLSQYIKIIQMKADMHSKKIHDKYLEVTENLGKLFDILGYTYNKSDKTRELLGYKNNGESQFVIPYENRDDELLNYLYNAEKPQFIISKFFIDSYEARKIQFYGIYVDIAKILGVKITKNDIENREDEKKREYDEELENKEIENKEIDEYKNGNDDEIEEKEIKVNKKAVKRKNKQILSPVDFATKIARMETTYFTRETMIQYRLLSEGDLIKKANSIIGKNIDISLERDLLIETILVAKNRRPRITINRDPRDKRMIMTKDPDIIKGIIREEYDNIIGIEPGDNDYSYREEKIIKSQEEMEKWNIPLKRGGEKEEKKEILGEEYKKWNVQRNIIDGKKLLENKERRKRDTNVLKDRVIGEKSKHISKYMLSSFLLSVAPYVSEYDLDSKYISDIIEEYTQPNVTNHQLFERVVNFLVYLQLNNAEILKDRIKNLYYISTILLELSPEDKLPEIFESGNEKAMESYAGYINTLKLVLEESMLMMIFTANIKSLTSYADTTARIQGLPINNAIENDYLEGSGYDFSYYEKCVNREDVRNVPAHNLAYYNDPSDNNIYCLDISSIVHHDEKNGEIINKYNGNPISKNFINKLKSTYNKDIPLSVTTNADINSIERKIVEQQHENEDVTLAVPDMWELIVDSVNEFGKDIFKKKEEKEEKKEEEKKEKKDKRKKDIESIKALEKSKADMLKEMDNQKERASRTAAMRKQMQNIENQLIAIQSEEQKYINKPEVEKIKEREELRQKRKEKKEKKELRKKERKEKAKKEEEKNNSEEEDDEEKEKKKEKEERRALKREEKRKKKEEEKKRDDEEGVIHELEGLEKLRKKEEKEEEEEEKQPVLKRNMLYFDQGGADDDYKVICSSEECAKEALYTGIGSKGKKLVELNENQLKNNKCSICDYRHVRMEEENDDVEMSIGKKNEKCANCGNNKVIFSSISYDGKSKDVFKFCSTDCMTKQKFKTFKK